MSGSLYDEDIVAWSEQQVDALRALAASAIHLPNGLDIEHVVEEIEEVGIGQRRAVERLAGQIFVHLVKLAAVPDSVGGKHWRAEIVAFHNDLLARITPSMRGRIDLEKVWSRALREAGARLDAMDAMSEDVRQCLVLGKLQGPPLDHDALSADEIDVDAVIARWLARN